MEQVRRICLKKSIRWQESYPSNFCCHLLKKNIQVKVSYFGSTFGNTPKLQNFGSSFVEKLLTLPGKNSPSLGGGVQIKNGLLHVACLSPRKEG